MYIGEVISNLYAEVKSTDSVHYALEKLNDLHFHQLPIVDFKDYKGVISEDQLLQIGDEDMTIEEIKLSKPFIYIFDSQHILDALPLITSYKTDFIPVLNKEMEYVGIITNNDILNSLNKILDGQDQGAIIVLELEQKDDSLAHIAHIIESENVKIVHASSRLIPETGKIEMTIRLNKNNISPVIASLYRFDYEIIGTYHNSEDQDELTDRYHHLMNYLDL